MIEIEPVFTEKELAHQVLCALDGHELKGQHHRDKAGTFTKMCDDCGLTEVHETQHKYTWGHSYFHVNSLKTVVAFYCRTCRLSNRNMYTIQVKFPGQHELECEEDELTLVKVMEWISITMRKLAEDQNRATVD